MTIAVGAAHSLWLALLFVHSLTQFTHLQQTALQTGCKEIGTGLSRTVEGADAEVDALVFGHVAATVAIRDHRSVANDNVFASIQLTGRKFEIEKLFE